MLEVCHEPVTTNGHVNVDFDQTVEIMSRGSASSSGEVSSFLNGMVSRILGLRWACALA